MPVIPKESMVLGGRTPLPLNRYSAEIKKAEVKTGRKEGAQPTLRISCEIIGPPSVEVNGLTYAAAGRWFNFMPNSIDPSVNWGLGRVQQGLEKSEFDFKKFNPAGDIDTDAFHVLVGHKFDIKLQTKEEFETRPCMAGERTEVSVGGEGHVYIRNARGEKLSKGHYVYNEKGVNPGWDDIVGPYMEDGGF